MALSLRRKTAPAAPQASASTPETAAERAVRAEAELATARADLAEARSGETAAQAEYVEALDAADVDAATAARARVTDAETLAEIAIRQVDRLAGELSAAREEERGAEVARIVAEAQAKSVAFRSATERDLPAMVSTARALVRAWAEAEIARAAANAALAEAGEPLLAPAEAFRSRRGRPRRALGPEEAVDLWVDGRGEALPAADQEAVRIDEEGAGILRRGHAVRRFTRKRRFLRLEYLAAEPDIAPPALAKALAVPGLGELDNAGWLPLADPTPQGVLRALASLERAREAEGDSRQPQVRLTPIPGEPVRDVTVPREVPTAALSRGIA